mmetsp:Transcript_10199/g.16738  ORF Transcript_10199/g.16738 Transcript_10199/m.16738 type:complete len:152 (+) Transcript_10199:30-485(+)
MVYFSSIVAAVLGLFEFFVASKLIMGEDSELKFFPEHFSSDPATKILLILFTIFLGMLRLSWAVSGRTYLSWLCVVVSHVVETVALWNMALLPHFNTENLLLVDFVQDLLAFSGKYDELTTKILLVIPVVLAFFILVGPGVTSTKNTTKMD